METTFKKLKKWLEKNNANKLASSLGYNSPSTISHWINRHPPGIPAREIDRVKAFLNSERTKRNEKCQRKK